MYKFFYKNIFYLQINNKLEWIKFMESHVFNYNKLYLKIVKIRNKK